MNPGEIMITVSPEKYADMVQFFLKQAGFTGNDSGQAGPDKRDLWLTIPQGSHPEEFGPYFEKQDTP